MENSRKRKRVNTCSIWKAKQEKHKVRAVLEDELADQCACVPVLSQLKPAFVSLVRQGAEFRHSKRVLPHPKNTDKQRYRNLVAQNAWIRANLMLWETTNIVVRTFYKLWTLDPSG